MLRATYVVSVTVFCDAVVYITYNVNLSDVAFVTVMVLKIFL